MCMAHHAKAKRAAARPMAPAAGGMETFLFDAEVETYQGLVDQITREVKPRNVGERLSIDRLARAMIQAGRYDAALIQGDKFAGRNLYFINLQIQNWVKVLGTDRRLRIKREDERGGMEALARKFPWMFKGGKKEVDLDRADGQEIEVVPRPDNERPSGVHGGSAENGTPREAETGTPEPSAVQDEGVGAEGRKVDS